MPLFFLISLIENRVEERGWAHSSSSLLLVWAVVAANVDLLALAIDEVVADGLLVLSQLRAELTEAAVLLGHGACPVHGNVVR